MLELTERGREYRDKVLAFMDEHIYPAEATYHAQMAESGDPHFHPPILEELKAKHACVGDVRYKGLFSAIELVRSKETREPLVPYGKDPEGIMKGIIGAAALAVVTSAV